MTQEIYSVLESAIRITEERDKKSLERVLVGTLADFIESDAIVLLRMSRGGVVLEEAAAAPRNARRQRFELISQEPGETRIKHDDGLDRCIEGCELVVEALDGTTRTLFPVGTNKKVSGVLAVHGQGCSDNTTTLIRGFLRIHGNFLAVLDENEHDTLTGLLNRRTFDTRISELISASLASPAKAPDEGAERRETCGVKSHWLGILDIDHFKKINDTYGHVYGDEVLLMFSGLMKSAFRSTDLLFRYGGEEFVVVLAPVDESNAFMVFERFRRRLESFEFPQIGRATASIGMVDVNARDHPAAVVEHADKALYYAKENGRNRTCNYHRLIDAGMLKEQRHEGDVELF